MDGIKFARPSTLSYYEFDDIIDFFSDKYLVSRDKLNDYFISNCGVSFYYLWHLFVDSGNFIVLNGFIRHKISTSMFQYFLDKVKDIEPANKEVFDGIIDFFSDLWSFQRTMFVNYGERYDFIR